MKIILAILVSFTGKAVARMAAASGIKLKLLID